MTNKDASLGIRLSQSLKDKLEKAAEKKGMTLSDYIRRLLERKGEK